jgi:hypothetical protein
VKLLGPSKSNLNALIEEFKKRTAEIPKMPKINLNPRQLKKLSGPSSFAFYPNLLGRRILLLGISHRTTQTCSCTVKVVGSSCYDVHQWLGDLAISGP